MPDDDPTPDDPPTPTADDVTNLKEAIRKERADAKAARTEKVDLERRLKELEDADKSETQKLRDALAEKDAALVDLPKQVRQQVVRFASEASRAGFLDPEDALLNIDVDLSDNDAVKAALADLAERKPHLVRTQKPPPKVPTRPTAGAGEHLGSAAGDANAKERAAAAMRSFSSTQ